MLKKLCARHHASTYISEESCFRSRQKNNPLANFVNVQVQFFQSILGKKIVYDFFIIHLPERFSTENDTPVSFSQIF